MTEFEGSVPPQFYGSNGQESPSWALPSNKCLCVIKNPKILMTLGTYSETYNELKHYGNGCPQVGLFWRFYRISFRDEIKSSHLKDRDDFIWK